MADFKGGRHTNATFKSNTKPIQNSKTHIKYMMGKSQSQSTPTKD
jgi:hypothetical protein